jgi:oxygen-independent coproporphyrinogen-3 oxidase
MCSVGLYIHIPFCQAKCAYCDFASYAGCEALFVPYLDALRREMRLARRVCHTLYVGGGTPTILPASDLAALIESARQTFGLGPDAEVTVEANPGTVDAASLRQLGKAGVCRLSLGVQSLDDGMLRLLGRIHTAEQAHLAVRDARAAGFDNLSLDLIFGLPGQTLAQWQEDVRRVLDLSPEHLSLYALTVEENTPLAASIEAGELRAPDDDLAAEMYAWAEEMLAEARLVHYEISNWALPGHACQHNLIYWRNEPYVGLGAAAHSWYDGVRRSNLRVPGEYIDVLRAGRSPIDEEEAIDPALEMGETMMMGLRLLEEGVSFARFTRRFGVSMDDVYRSQIEGLITRGLLARTPDRIHLTKRGHLLGNQVFAEFLPQ